MLFQQACEPDIVQGHAHACVLPQGADFCGFLAAMERVVVQTEFDQVLEMVWGGITGAGFPTDHGLA